MARERVEDWNDDEDDLVDIITWNDKDGEEESISLNYEDTSTLNIKNSEGCILHIYRSDIPKIKKALEIAIHYCWNEGDAF